MDLLELPDNVLGVGVAHAVGQELPAVLQAREAVIGLRRAAPEPEAGHEHGSVFRGSLREIAEVPDHLVLGPENRDLCGEARDWEGRLGDLAHEIRCRVREVEGEPAPGTVPLADDEDVPLGPVLRT